MGKAKKTRKFAEVKRMLNPKDLKPYVALALCLNLSTAVHGSISPTSATACFFRSLPCRMPLMYVHNASTLCSPAPKKDKAEEVKQVDKTPAALFFRYNTQLGPPYHVIVDTNFINFSIKNKIDLVKGMMDCLYAQCTPCITDCVMAELEKLGQKYRVALKIAKDPRLERLPCNHKGTYADDCICERVKQHRCYIVATCDRDLRRRIRKIPGVPIMYIQSHRYSIERLPEATIGGAPRT
jgi:U3 small nucleolar RNA-associated protein 24